MSRWHNIAMAGLFDFCETCPERGGERCALPNRAETFLERLRSKSFSFLRGLAQAYHPDAVIQNPQNEDPDTRQIRLIQEFVDREVCILEHLFAASPDEAPDNPSPTNPSASAE